MANRSNLITLFECVTGYGAEIGVYKGEFSKEILAGYSGKLILVDPFKGNFVGLGPQDWRSVLAECLNNIDVNRVRFITKLSAEAVDEVDDGSLDFAYIDADHQYHMVEQDIELWYPKIRKGGILCGHDYLNTDKFELDPEQGVNRAVDEFVKTRNIPLLLTDEDKWKSWYLYAI